MRTIIAFAIALAFLLCSAHAASSPTLFGTLSSAMPSDAILTLQEFSLGGSVAYAVIYQDHILMILKNSSLTGYAPVSDRQDVKNALYAYRVSQGDAPLSLSDFSGMHESVGKMELKKRGGESECRRLLGTDTRPCISFDTCQVACYSITSFCAPVALGAGRLFINEIWAFENNSAALDDAYSDERHAYVVLTENLNGTTVANYVSALAMINKAATTASQSRLYDSYSYCFSPDYALPEITYYQQQAERAVSRAAPLKSLDGEVDGIVGFTAKIVAIDSALRSISPVQDAPPSSAAQKSASSGASKNSQQPSGAVAPPSQQPAQYAVMITLDAATGAFIVFAVLIFWYVGQGVAKGFVKKGKKK